ncbi:transcription factor Adf-1-like [Myripristis murdjan]|uniref:transcription factor Adf-1-like n=1 Tax=Myripristis murdjan TaxID=586833 RepID=UPI0011760795|nr:transcription factor Adf-1-like [Myripristis murdjan]
MDDKLILSVFNFPELYNVTLPNYRCTESRTNAWRNISALVGVPSEECKRKWKNLRDRYLKEVRMEIKSKQQGEMIPSRWKYRQLLNFLAPFTGSRNGTTENGNNEEDHENPDNESGNTEGETTAAEGKTQQAAVKIPANQGDSKTPVAFLTQLPPMSQDTQLAQLAVLTKIPPGSKISPTGKPGRKRRMLRDALSLPCSQTTLIPAKRQAKDSSLPNRPRDEDELFLLSFVPALKRLAPQKRCETKIRIQQIMYEAEFNVSQPEPQEKPPETQD